MAPLDLIEPIAHRNEKIRVGCEDCAIKGKLDDGLGAMKGVELTIMVDSSQDLIRDVRGKFDHSGDASHPVQHTGLYVAWIQTERPSLAMRLNSRVCGSPRRRASRRRGRHRCSARRRAHIGCDAVPPPLQGVAHQGEEIGVGSPDGSRPARTLSEPVTCRAPP